MRAIIMSRATCIPFCKNRIGSDCLQKKLIQIQMEIKMQTNKANTENNLSDKNMINTVRKIKDRLKLKAHKLFETGKKINALSNSKPSDSAGTEDQINFDRSNKISTDELSRLMGMDYARFSNVLPYRYFDTDDQLFINDQSVGLGLELAPLAGANEEIIHAISEMIKNKIGDEIGIQVMMVGNNKVGSLISNFIAPYKNQGTLFEVLGKNQHQYLKHAAIKGFNNKRNISMPLRDYRCFLFASKRCGYSKRQAAALSDLRDEIKSELKNTGIPTANLNIESFLSF